MKTKEIEEILKQFTKYWDGYKFLEDDEDDKPSITTKSYYHYEIDGFNLEIFDDKQVFQGGTEGDTIGVELQTLEEFKIRFKSFTGINFN